MTKARPTSPASATTTRWVAWALALLAAVLTLVLVASSAVASPACPSCAPWWHLTAGSRPTALQAGLARDEVQQLTVNATEGEFTVARELIVGPPEKISSPVPVEFGATAQKLQEALEGLYGPGAVEVTGGPAAGQPYRITFTGELGDQPLVPLVVSGVSLAGGAHEASIREITKGRPDGEVVVTAENLGDAAVNGGGTPTPVNINDVLPPGLTPVGIGATRAAPASFNEYTSLPCSLKTVSCEMPETLPPYEQVEMRVAVRVEPGFLSGAVNEAHISGGEAPEATAQSHVALGTGEPPFGLERYELTNEEEGGSLTTQAGAHPFQQTTTVNVNQGANTRQLLDSPNVQPSGGLAKDLRFNWPAGLIGNPQAVPHCTLGQFVTAKGALEDQCPPESAVGSAAVVVYEPATLKRLTLTVPLFNVEPAHGEPARFGFFVSMAHVPVVIDPSLRTGGDYGITVASHNISQTASFLSVQVTVWGVPGDPRHDSTRGWGCLLAAHEVEPTLRAPCNVAAQERPPAFLSMPTSCNGPLQSTAEGDSWSTPALVQELFKTPMPALDGCNQLPFSSAIKATPDGQAASTPTGLNVDVHVPQDSILNGAGLASSDVKDISVTFPEGVVLNPAAADGLQACTEAQIGFTGFAELNPLTEAGNQTAQFTSGLPAPKGAPAEPFCPDSSKIGNATISTPLLPDKLEGALYLATPAPNGELGKNPFNSLLAVYLVAEDPISGSLVKLPGEVTLNQTTGQITTTFKNNPQVAFEDAEIHLYGGDRAPFATPAHCGAYTTNASFTPWSGSSPVSSQSSFNIISGPNGSACPTTLPFAPGFNAQTTSVNAGGFSPLVTNITREDGNQDLKTVVLHMPPGVSGILKGVPLCPEAQAKAGTCSPESEIGKTVVSVGLGGDPFSVTGGKVYLTETYKGAPFGLSIVNPAVAGPFDLGKVIVRATIQVDPTTAALTVTTDEIPHILKGIPLQIKHVNVTIDRPGFTFNPTNCNPLALTGTIGSVEGASSPVSVPFQVTNCAALKFSPQVHVSTGARSSKQNGASLLFKIAYPKNAMGSQSWFKEAKFDLPKQLPARLTTIQKACLSAVFETNPAACPPASLIGHATVHTPVLPVPLQGPVYFVSHGGAKFPDAVLLLQGYGVTIKLVGSTFINGKTGVTSATFANTPDVPFDNIEVTIPTGPFSEFGANLPARAKGSFCGQKLVVPTLFKAQNGLEIHQNTAVGVSGCPKSKKATRAQRLAAAMRACRKTAKSKRAACARAARRRYGAIGVKRRK